MPRFVFLLHCWPDCPRHHRSSRGPCHWDLMFESEERLVTWGVDAIDLRHFTAEAIQLPDHRLAYLDYQGPLSENRGFVRQVLSGEYRVESASGGSLDPGDPHQGNGPADGNDLRDFRPDQLTSSDRLRLVLSWPLATLRSTVKVDFIRTADDRWNLILDPHFNGWPQIFAPAPESLDPAGDG